VSGRPAARPDPGRLRGQPASVPGNETRPGLPDGTGRSGSLGPERGQLAACGFIPCPEAALMDVVGDLPIPDLDAIAKLLRGRRVDPGDQSADPLKLLREEVIIDPVLLSCAEPWAGVSSSFRAWSRKRTQAAG
jgi:hypothetical protein